MTETRPPKKSGKLKFVFKWMFNISIALLLILAIFVHAPWKVITILAVIFVANSLAPMPIRKWFWRCVAAIVLALAVWVFLPAKTGTWRPYTCEEEFAAFEAQFTIPNDINAAIIYKDLFAAYDDPNVFYPDCLSGDNRNVNFLTESHPFSSKDYPQVAKWLLGLDGLIGKLMLVCKKEKCVFPLNLYAENPAATEHLGPMRAWARVLVRAANNDIGDGRLNRGITKILCAQRICDHLRQQPATMDYLIGMGIDGLVLELMNTLSIEGFLNDEHIALLDESLTRSVDDWEEFLPKIIEHQKFPTKNWLLALFYEIDKQGNTRFIRNGIAGAQKLWPPDMREDAIQTYWHARLTKLSVLLESLFIPPTPQEASERIDRAYTKLHAMAEPEYTWPKHPPKPFYDFRLNYQALLDGIVRRNESLYYEVHDHWLRHLAHNRGARIILALCRYRNEHGHWPEALDEIKVTAPAEMFIDPFNDGEFVYKLIDDTFTLYSKGKNDIDQNGRNYNTSPYWDNATMGDDDEVIWAPENDDKPQDEQSE